MKNFIYDYLAAQGRNGDSELRNVSGELSHVNTKEARAIDDYGVLGELITKEAGAGTLNPSTGLPEYYTGDYSDMDWGQFQDMDRGQFAGMSDEERLALSQSLGYSGTTQEDMDEYFPSYDTTAEDRVAEDSALQIGRIGEGAQSTLLKFNQGEESNISSRNFENTGNPMIDQQRENIFSQITNTMGDARRTMERSIHDIREQAMQKFGNRVMTMEDRVNAEKAANAPKEKGFFTKAWDKSLGVDGLGKLFSDERLKDNIQFQHVDNIGMPVYTYNYTYDKGTPQIGYMAQDVEKMYPDAVSESQGFKKVDYSKIIQRAESLGGK
jgi:hypothetical protein|tara:strand:+ start:4645 stop:5619 length:975 start_codon:yes stop_codon:yes gene_type:complete